MDHSSVAVRQDGSDVISGERIIARNRPLSEEETKEWNGVFALLAPESGLPPLGSPQQKTLSLLADYFGRERAFEAMEPFKVPWLSTEMHNSLLREARSVRERAIEAEGMHLAYGGRLSQLLTHSRLLFEWAYGLVPARLAGDARGGYIYYEGESSYCPIHIDRPLAYEINLLITLEHVPGNGGTTASSFIVTSSGYRYYQIKPGWGSLFHATNTLHGRERFSRGETAIMFSIGFGAYRE